MTDEKKPSKLNKVIKSVPVTVITGLLMIIAYYIQQDHMLNKQDHEKLQGVEIKTAKTDEKIESVIKHVNWLDNRVCILEKK